MKKITLLIVSMLMVTLLAMAQIKFIVYKADGSTIELLATEVDSIGFEGNNVQPETPDSPDKPDSPVEPYIPNANGHEYVDLGLPSGTLWATMNVGATSAVDYGYYFCWGETTPRTTEYKVSDYKLYEGQSLDINNDSHFSIFVEGIKKYSEKDKKTVLEYEDDAARANWGGDWRMPTFKELEELVMNCIIDNIQKNGKEYYRFTSIKNNQSIILPMSGAYMNLSQDGPYFAQYGIDEEGLYWSSEICDDSEWNGYLSYVYSSSMQMGEGTPEEYILGYGDGMPMPRVYAQSVRAVLPSKKVHTITFNANGGRGNMSSVDANYAELFTIPTNKFTHAQQDFVCWNTKADGSGKTYMETDKFSVSSDITLYAQWKKIGSDNEEGKLPETPTGFMAPGEGKIRFSIDATEVDACYGLGIEGNFCGYDPNTAFKGTEFGQNMFYIDIPSMTAEEFGNAKILLLNEDGHSDWAYQVSNESYDITASEDYITLVDDYGTLNAINLISDNIDNVVIKIAILAVNDTPCKPDVPAGFAKFVLTVTGDIPEGKKVIFTGDFGADNDEWSASTREMTKQADGTYVWEGAYPENFQFKAFIADCEDLGITDINGNVKEELWLTGRNFKLTAEDGAVINFLGCFDEFCPVEEAPAE